MSKTDSVTTSDYLPHHDIRGRYAELVCLTDDGELSYSDQRRLENIENVFPRWSSDAKRLWGFS